MGSRWKFVMGAILSLFCITAFGAPRVIIDSQGDGVEFHRLTGAGTSEIVASYSGTATEPFSFDLGLSVPAGGFIGVGALDPGDYIEDGIAIGGTGGTGPFVVGVGDATNPGDVNIYGIESDGGGLTEYAEFADGSITLREPVTAADTGLYPLTIGTGAAGASKTLTFDVGGTGDAILEWKNTSVAGTPKFIHRFYDGSTYTTLWDATSSAINLYKPVTADATGSAGSHSFLGPTSSSNYVASFTSQSTNPYGVNIISSQDDGTGNGYPLIRIASNDNVEYFRVDSGGTSTFKKNDHEVVLVSNNNGSNDFIGWQFEPNGSTTTYRGFVGISDSTNGFVQGAVAGDMNLTTKAHNINLSVDDGVSIGLKLDSSSQLTIGKNGSPGLRHLVWGKNSAPSGLSAGSLGLESDNGNSGTGVGLNLGHYDSGAANGSYSWQMSYYKGTGTTAQHRFYNYTSMLGYYTNTDWSLGFDGSSSNSFAIAGATQGNNVVLVGMDGSAGPLIVPGESSGTPGSASFRLSAADNYGGLLYINNWGNGSSCLVLVGYSNQTVIVSETSTGCIASSSPSSGELGVVYSNTGSMVTIYNPDGSARSVGVVAIGTGI
jgi:hypothetical protein